MNKFEEVKLQIAIKKEIEKLKTMSPEKIQEYIDSLQEAIQLNNAKIEDAKERLNKVNKKIDSFNDSKWVIKFADDAILASILGGLAIGCGSGIATGIAMAGADSSIVSGSVGALVGALVGMLAGGTAGSIAGCCAPMSYALYNVLKERALNKKLKHLNEEKYEADYTTQLLKENGLLDAEEMELGK